MKFFLKQTIYLLPYLLMVVSFLSIIVPWIGFKFDFVTWGNSGGFSIITDVAFIYLFYYDKLYCWLTRHLPFSLLFINIINIISNEFFKDYYELYGQLYEVIVFSLTLFVALIVFLNKKLNT